MRIRFEIVANPRSRVTVRLRLIGDRKETKSWGRSTVQVKVKLGLIKELRSQ